MASKIPKIKKNIYYYQLTNSVPSVYNIQDVIHETIKTPLQVIQLCQWFHQST